MTESTGRGRGRPKGSKNKKTLMKEAYEGEVVEKMQMASVPHMTNIVHAMAVKAEAGDVQAAKLFFDRWWPAQKQTDGEMTKAPITIQIGVTEGFHYGIKQEGQTIEAAAEQSPGEEPIAETSSNVVTLSHGSQGSSEGA